MSGDNGAAIDADDVDAVCTFEEVSAFHATASMLALPEQEAMNKNTKPNKNTMKPNRNAAGKQRSSPIMAVLYPRFLFN